MMMMMMMMMMKLDYRHDTALKTKHYVLYALLFRIY